MACREVQIETTTYLDAKNKSPKNVRRTNLHLVVSVRRNSELFNIHGNEHFNVNIDLAPA